MLTTEQALSKLHQEIAEELQIHENEQANEEKKWISCNTWKWDAYHHKSHYSTLRWMNGFMLLLEALFLFISYGVTEDPRCERQIVEGIVIVLLVFVNVTFVGWDCRLRRHEIQDRVRELLIYLADCAQRCKWVPSNYPQLNTPLSPCITLQWTYRDGHLVNLHWSLLVKGDVIALRPGQIVPATCRPFRNETGAKELKFGEQFVPSVDYTHEANFHEPRVRRPLSTTKYVLLETPYRKNLRLALSQSCNRPISVFDKERFHICSYWVSQILLPISFAITLFVNIIRYMFLSRDVGHWTEMFILLQLQVVLPLLPLLFPFLWLILNVYGVARLHTIFHSVKEAKVDLEPFDEYGEILPIIPSCKLTWVALRHHFLDVLLGKAAFPCRTANLLHVLGSVTALCCVDKKGLLSWPNPTAEKVFFLRTRDHTPEPSRMGVAFHSTGSLNKEHLGANPNGFTKRRHSSRCKAKHTRSCTRESTVEVLDLTHDNQVPFGLQFDDLKWKQYLNSLKPLGLAILLNTCNPATQDHYSQFTAHIAYEVLHNEDVVPVINRRCLCELARQIGFTEQAMGVFQLQEQLSTFRPMSLQQPDLMRKDRFAKSLSITKLKFPFPHMVSVVVKENSTGMLQLLSQGTGDIILDSCRDYWDGQDLHPLTESDRKKILDFYHRTSLTSYCTAFAYRPLTATISHKFSELYLELPADSSGLYPMVRSPTPTKSWDLHSVDQCVKHRWAQYFSTDSLFGQETDGEAASDVGTCFEVQCNQVFIGMVTMQYQARMDVVHLIEQLDKACIRFVHFSKENELRSRVFSEKMGLESGWNCHISLFSEDVRSESGNSSIHFPLNLPDQSMVLSSDNQFLPKRLGHGHMRMPQKLMCFPLEKQRFLSFSAPSVINLECALVKFGDEVSLYDFNNQSGSLREMREYCDDNLSDDNCSSSDVDMEEPLVSHCRDRIDDSSASRSPSHVTESTEHSGAPVGFDMSNRAKLPKGIENIRPHLKNIDNVPLLVSLFTDCIPEATREMIEIMQENGEVVCCVGSAANCHNMALFLQADASIAVEPLYPQLCMKQPVFLPPSEEHGPPSVEISHQLNSITSALSFYREDPVSIYHLIIEARHFTVCLRNCFQFMLASLLSVTLLQILAIVLFLPIPINSSHVLWLICVIIPLLSISLINNPIDPHVTTMATGKNRMGNEVAMYFTMFIGAKFLPSVLVCISSVLLTLHNFCQQVSSNPNACGYHLGNRNFSRPHEWNGWGSDYWTSFRMVQNMCTFLLVFYFVIISTSFVHKYHQLWQRSLLQNKLWCCVAVIVLLLQAIYYMTDVAIHSDPTGKLPGIGDLPLSVWLLVFLWPVLLIALNETIKRYEIRANIRYQKKARLEFGTKLGMNSPF